jgi:formylglycine-generating enzyme required for sulfatase activity
MRRRKFMANVVTGASGGLILGLPGISQACSRTKEASAMVTIPSGVFLMGTQLEQVLELASQYGYHPSWMESEAPQREVNLPEFQIDRYPVTNKQYHQFCAETGYSFPEHWEQNGPGVGILDHPVVYVDKMDAMAYVKWAGKRLPTEAEWEKAARGTDGRLFPWGNEFNPEACCWNRSGMDGVTTDPVDAHSEGASPYGVMDMAGNVMEWCSDGPEDAPKRDNEMKFTAFIKGGAWLSSEVIELRPAARGNAGAVNNKLEFIGFRCVEEVNHG